MGAECASGYHLAILAWFRGLPRPGHDEPHHTMIGATMVAVLV